MAAVAVAGMAMMLLGPWTVASPLGQRLLHLYCFIGPIISAFSCIFKLAVSGLFVAAMLAAVSMSIEGPHAQESK
jgi:hypothetical protein